MSSSPAPKIKSDFLPVEFFTIRRKKFCHNRARGYSGTAKREIKITKSALPFSPQCKKSDSRLRVDSFQIPKVMQFA